MNEFEINCHKISQPTTIFLKGKAKVTREESKHLIIEGSFDQASVLIFPTDSTSFIKKNSVTLNYDCLMNKNNPVTILTLYVIFLFTNSYHIYITDKPDE